MMSNNPTSKINNKSLKKNPNTKKYNFNKDQYGIIMTKKDKNR